MSVPPIPSEYPRVMPYLITSDAAATLRFVEEHLGGEVFVKMEHSPGVIMHAEARIGDSVVMFAQASEQWPAIPAMLYVYVEDVDAVHSRAVAAGVKSTQEPTTQFYGDRSATLADAGGIQWCIATQVEKVSEAEMARRSAEFKGKDPGAAG